MRRRKKDAHAKIHYSNYNIYDIDHFLWILIYVEIFYVCFISHKPPGLQPLVHEIMFTCLLIEMNRYNSYIVENVN